MTPELGALPLAGIPELCGPYAKNVRKASALCRIYIPFFILIAVSVCMSNDRLSLIYMNLRYSPASAKQRPVSQSVLSFGFGSICAGTLICVGAFMFLLAWGGACSIGNLSLLSERFITWPENIALAVLAPDRRGKGLRAGTTSCTAITKLATPTIYGSEYSVTFFTRMTPTTTPPLSSPLIAAQFLARRHWARVSLNYTKV